MSANNLGLGYSSTLEIDTGSNDGTFSTHPDISGWSTFNFTLRSTNPDSTRVDTGGFEGKEYGILGASLSADIFDDQANDTAQDQLIADFWARTKRWVRIRSRVGTGYIQVAFKAVINNAAYTSEQGGIVRFNLALDSDGTVTVSDQT